MRGLIVLMGGFSALYLVLAAHTSLAQQEVYRPGETYDSLQAGRDAYWDAEAERRARIGRQILLEEQIMLQNTWADPQDRYRPVHPESYGPVAPKSYTGPTLADTYAYPPTDGGAVFYGGHAATAAMTDGGSGGSYGAPVPVFQPWPRVPNDIWGTPYYGYVRQPIGHIKIWTSRLAYIYKPIYASPPIAAAPTALPARTTVPQQRCPVATSITPPADASSPTALLNTPPPPPKPALPRATTPRRAANPTLPAAPPLPAIGQEL